MSKIINLKTQNTECKDTIFKFITLTQANLEELKRELCRKYENWEITQDEFNASIIMSIRLNTIFKELKKEIENKTKGEENDNQKDNV